MSLYVVTRNSDDSIHYGPASWGKIRSRFGLKGNKSIPDLPFVRGNYTLREVVYDKKNEFQNSDDGRVDGDVWRFGTRWKDVDTLKSTVELEIHKRHDKANELSSISLASRPYTDYEAAKKNNWDRRAALLSSVDSATTRADLNKVWQNHNMGWSS